MYHIQPIVMFCISISKTKRNIAMCKHIHRHTNTFRLLIEFPNLHPLSKCSVYLFFEPIVFVFKIWMKNSNKVKRNKNSPFPVLIMCVCYLFHCFFLTLGIHIHTYERVCMCVCTLHWYLQHHLVFEKENSKFKIISNVSTSHLHLALNKISPKLFSLSLSPSQAIFAYYFLNFNPLML